MPDYKDISTVNPKDNIIIKGAKIHNLKNIDVVIPRNKFVVITGLSGSGKSSLAFDTLYADGQRRYVESLSSYARQFLGRMSKPEVDYIKGIAPAIAIEQKVSTRNPRSTVGTSTEIYEYLKLLFARIGKTYSPKSGKLVKCHKVSDVTDHIISQASGSKVNIYCPLIIKHKRSLQEQLLILVQQGFTRIRYKNEILRIDDFLKNIIKYKNESEIYIIIDRLLINTIEEELISRISDSVQLAFYEGNGRCFVETINESGNTMEIFSNKFELDGINFEKPGVNLFSFNNPFGACKVCEGFGSVIGIDEDLVIPNKNLSVYDGAIACWKGEKMGEWKEQLVMNAYKFDFPIHKTIYELTEEQKTLLWTGNEFFHGLKEFFQYVEDQTYKIQYRVMLSRYRGKTICPDCKGTKLRKDSAYVKVGEKSISDIVLMSIQNASTFFKKLSLNKHEQTISKRLLIEINNRLDYLLNVGLGYLTLNRTSSTLSGGESQRINLATSLGSSLVGSMYILDEPSIGLHAHDISRLTNVLLKLRDIGNTVIVVEHEEEIIKAADEIIDIGPLAGQNGGELVFHGSYNEILKDDKSLTGQYLSNKLHIKIPDRRRNWKDYIEIKGARENNLKGFDIKMPLNVLCLVTGVSGSGKTSLVKNILYTSLRKIFGGYGEKTGKFEKISGDINRLSSVELIDQKPIGRSSRSNPATYVKAYDDIRSLFADQKLSKMRAYKAGHFSFNIAGGRCDECEGDGVVKIEMQFMADIYLKCESCRGKRFKEDTLDIEYQNKNISNILDMTINQAIDFFGSGMTDSNYEKRIIHKLKPLQDVGLGYLRLGQPSNTLSGGESQRIKLASFLIKGVSEKPTLFIFDEPTTGLHFHDINKLYQAFNALIEKGHSLVVIEHNMEVIKCADWIIDLGPGGGEDGGEVVFQGTPEKLIEYDGSYTGKYLRYKI